jgi:hypothetical protein
MDRSQSVSLATDSTADGMPEHCGHPASCDAADGFRTPVPLVGAALPAGGR